MSGKYLEVERLDGSVDVEPCDLMTWARVFESKSRWQLRDEVGSAYVSTVFLGLDHSFGHGRPVLYETMVFGGPLDEEQERYHTRAEAVAGHAAMLHRMHEAIK